MYIFFLGTWFALNGCIDWVHWLFALIGCIDCLHWLFALICCIEFQSKTRCIDFFSVRWLALIGCIDCLHWLFALIGRIEIWSKTRCIQFFPGYMVAMIGCIDWLHWLVALIHCRSHQACVGFNKIFHTCNTALPQVWRFWTFICFLHSTRLFLDKNHVLQAFSKIIAKTSFNALVATFIGSRGLGLGLLPLDYAGASVFAASSNTAFLCASCFLSLVLDTAQLYSRVCTLVVHWVLLSCLCLITRLSISPSTCFLISGKPCCSALSLCFIDVTRLCQESGCEMWYDIVLAP